MSKTVYAKSKYVRTSPRKARLVVDMVRGKAALQAVDILKFTNKSVALHVRKVVESAIANATHNEGWNKDNLIIAEAFVNEAPTLKRGKAVSRGRYHQIFRRNSHIIIGIKDKTITDETATKKEAVTETTKKEVKPEVKKEKKSEAKTKTPKAKTTKKVSAKSANKKIKK